jgi:hypothetical protein
MAIDSASGEEEEDEEEEGGEDYEVEGIVDHKKSKGGWLFLVKWVGYDDEENTWEPEVSLAFEVESASWRSGVGSWELLSERAMSSQEREMLEGEL